MTNERDRAATVIAQEADRVQVEHEGERLTVPMRGFPPGFTVRRGARVVLFDEPTGPVARPLVRAITSRLPPQAVETPATFEVQGRRLEMQASTIIEDAQARDHVREPDEFVLWILERGEADPPDQVVALRRRSPR